MKIWNTCGVAVMVLFNCFGLAACDEDSTNYADQTTSVLDATIWHESVKSDGLVRDSMKGVQVGGGIEWYTDMHPLSTTVTLFPTRAQWIEDEAYLDATLADYLILSICEVDTAADCRELRVLTAIGCSALKGCSNAGAADFYRAPWYISENLLGKNLQIHFLVAGLDVGFIEVVPVVNREVTIRFTVASHPRIRGRIRTEQGLSVPEIAEALMREFRLDPLQATRICFEEGHETLPVAATLKDLKLDAYSTAQVLMDVGFELNGIYTMLQEVYRESRESTGQIIVHLLTERGISSAKIAGIMKDECAFAPAEITRFLVGEDHNIFFIASALKQILGIDAPGAAYILTGAGVDTTSVYSILQTIFGEGPASSGQILVEVLEAEGHSVAEIATIFVIDLNLSVAEISQLSLDMSATTPENLASALIDTRWTCRDVGELLRAVYPLDDPVRTGEILSNESCVAEEIFHVFTDIYGLDEFAAEKAFADMGWQQEDYLWITAYSHVKQFAPQLLFHEYMSDYPMDAQKWFEVMLCEGNDSKACFERNWNEDKPLTTWTIKILRDGHSAVSTIEGGKIPTYYRMSTCGLGQLRIEYWWFYGNQPECSPGTGWGHHPADWERIMVISSDDRTEIAAILYYQHSGWYIKNCKRWHPDGGNHPYVYVGKNNHGSYFKGGGIGGCFYFEDKRFPVWSDVPDGTIWKTWELSTFINVLGPEYSPDLPDRIDLPKEMQQSWIKYTKERGDKFPWGYLDGEAKVYTNPFLNDGGVNGMCDRTACNGYEPFGAEGCYQHTDCKCCKDHTDIGLYCEAGAFQLYDKDYWVPTFDRGLCGVYSTPSCFPGTDYCPCKY